MGADLYISKLFDENCNRSQKHIDKWVAIRNNEKDPEKAKEAQKKVSYWYDRMYSKGYFRDSYNASSLFHMIGLSEFVNKNGLITPTNAKKLLAVIESKQIPTLEKGWCKKHYCKGTEKEWQVYFSKKKKLFENFLKTAIKLKEPIKAST